MLDLIIKNGSCYIDKDLKNQDIAVKDGKIVEIGKISDEAKEIFDAKNLTVLPGCIDTQTHFREPGSTDTEDLHSGSRAAIAGGCLKGRRSASGYSEVHMHTMIPAQDPKQG